MTSVGLTRISGETRHIDLGSGSRPHGVITGPDGVAWITDGGRNSIQKFDPAPMSSPSYPLPADRPDANLNTAAFDGDGQLWFTGQNGIVGVLDPDTGAMEVFSAPRGRGPTGSPPPHSALSTSRRWPAAMSASSATTGRSPSWSLRQPRRVPAVSGPTRKARYG